jgi:putative aldouronate transport system permease protein
MASIKTNIGDTIKIKKKEKTVIQKIGEQKYLLLFLLPCIIWLIVFCYTPMVGIIIAFKDYKLAKGIFGSSWVGLTYFKQFFQSPMSRSVVRNTLAISFIKLVFGFPIPIIFALLLNEIRNKFYLRTVQTISYLPHFLSWVITIALFNKLLSVDGGIINVILENMGKEPINFFGEPNLVWPLAYLTETWKETGWNAIIYIAALAGIDPQLYEAATIDGASKLQRTWHISLPGIKGTIMVLLILASSNVFNANFDQLYMMRNDAIIDTVEVIDTYVYQRAMFNLEYSFGTAMGLMKSVLNVTLLLIMNELSKLFTGESFF